MRRVMVAILVSALAGMSVSAQGPAAKLPEYKKDVSRGVTEAAAGSTGISQDLLKKMLPILAMAVMGYMMRGKSGGGGVGGGMLGGILGQVVGGMLRR